MNKRTLLSAAAGLVLVVAVGAVLYMASRDSPEPPAKDMAVDMTTPTTYAKAKAVATAGKCLEKDPSITLPADVLEDIELSAVSHLIDVPAGTEVDVQLASYDGKKVAGSDRYPEAYGSYNFIMEKQSAGWVITSFKHCG